MTIAIKPTASGSTIEQNGSTILTVDSSGNIAIANDLTVTGTAPIPDALSTASGSAPSYSARAWVNFTGTGAVTINGSGNVSSITDNTTGDYTINFTTAMPDVNYNVTTGYSVNPSAGQKNTFAIDIESQTTTTCQLYTISGGAATDTSRVFVSIFR
jgi:hypothetical protein